jgi:hypothetical protein
MITRATLISWALLAVLAAHGPAIAEPSNRISDRNRQKQAAEQERAELRKKLSDLKEDIVKTEKARGDAADALGHRPLVMPAVTAHAVHGTAFDVDPVQPGGGWVPQRAFAHLAAGGWPRCSTS